MFNKDLYNYRYHEVDLSNYSFLITGGAGFIGSNLVEYLLKFNAKHVRVLDNLSNGYFENIKDFIGLSNFEFIEGDIRDYETCQNAVLNIDFISHQAALGSVPRSIENPILTNDVNVSGFLNMLVASQKSQFLKRFIYAASSSTYGDSVELPKVEGKEGKPLSPYAVTKAVNEYYSDVFSKVYGFNTIGLRYFNVFGPKQNPNNPYAAVIPLFCNAFLNNLNPIIFGDGETSRDFTFIENVVQANIKSFFTGELIKSEVFNVACGDQTTLNEIVSILQKISKLNLEAVYKVERVGDVKHSKASIDKIANMLKYTPLFDFKKGTELVYSWYSENNQKVL